MLCGDSTHSLTQGTLSHEVRETARKNLGPSQEDAGAKSKQEWCTLERRGT